MPPRGNRNLQDSRASALFGGRTISALSDSQAVSVGWGGTDIFVFNGALPSFNNANLAAFYGGGAFSPRYHTPASWTAQCAMRSQGALAIFEYLYGKSGATSAGIRDDVMPYLLNSPVGLPDEIIINAGSNDFGSGFTVAQTIAAVDDLINTMLDAGVVPTVSAVLPSNNSQAQADFVYKQNVALCQLARARAVDFANVWGDLADPATGQWRNAAWTRDGIHPSARGSQIIGWRYWQTLAARCTGKAAGFYLTNHDANAAANGTNSNLMAIAGAAINVAGSYPADWAVPTTAAMCKMNNAAGAEPGAGGFSMQAVPALASETLSPSYLGQSFTLQGQGTAANYGGNVGNALTLKPGDRLCIRFRIKSIVDQTAAQLGQAAMKFLDNSGHPIAGLAGENVNGRNAACGIGNEAGYPAGDFIQFLTWQTPVDLGTGGFLYGQLNNNNGTGTNANDSMTVANVIAVNLTQFGLVPAP